MTVRLSVPVKAEAKIVAYLQTILQAKRNFSAFNSKLAAIDIGYYCYRNPTKIDAENELDISNLMKHEDISIPMIIAQVDSLRAYFADVYLSGSPMFPVASKAALSTEAETFEALIEDHVLKGRYARQLMLAFTDASKYNLAGIEVNWDTIPSFIPELTDDDGYSLSQLRHLDPYNMIWDYRVAPADVGTNGEYAGDVRLISHIALKTLITKLASGKKSLNSDKAFKVGTLETGSKGMLEYSGAGNTAAGTVNYVNKPQISRFIQSTASQNAGNWADYIKSGSFGKRSLIAFSNMYELTTLYARILPSNLGIRVSKPNTPQVWKFELINGSVLLSAEPVSTPHGILPVIITQPQEDGFNYQTPSSAEAQLPLQKAASDLYNTRIASAKRAINDRMLYDPDRVDSMDINTGEPAAKIPIKANSLTGSIEGAVKLLPFDGNSTAGALSDMSQTIQLSYNLTGLNPFRQGQTQKGNRTLAEFDSIVNFSDLRTRVLALMLEHQFMQPLKSLLKFNVLTNLSQVEFTDSRTGEDYSVDVGELAKAAMEFKVADGYTPKSKLMGTEDLQNALLFIQNNPQLSATYDVGAIFAHLMSLRGVKGISQYAYTEKSKEAIIQQALPILQEMQNEQDTKTKEVNDGNQ